MKMKIMIWSQSIQKNYFEWANNYFFQIHISVHHPIGIQFKISLESLYCNIYLVIRALMLRKINVSGGEVVDM